MKSLLRRIIGPALVLATVLLSGCATSYVLDNDVQSFSSLTALPSQPTYRFERLPSQQAPDHTVLESMADPALHKAGLRRDDSNPRYSVQVSARIQPVLSPWADPWDTWGWGGFGRHHRRFGYGFGFGSRLSSMESPWYHREVAVVIRRTCRAPRRIRKPGRQRRTLVEQRGDLPADVRGRDARFSEPAGRPAGRQHHGGAHALTLGYALWVGFRSGCHLE